MIPQDKMTAVIGAAHAQILHVCLEHEREAHDGAPCLNTRASAVAHLAHCLGVRGEAWDYAQQLLTEYDANCADRNCPHEGSFPP